LEFLKLSSRSRRVGLPRAILAFIAVSLLAGAVPANAQDAGLEIAIKATYLYKFAPFVEWPATAYGSGTFNLCIVGDDPFGAILNRAVSDQRVGQRNIAVKRYPTLHGPVDCQIMFLAGSAAQPVADELAAVRNAPILTVTDQPDGAKAKGAINFVLRDNHVRFEIDNAAATRNALSISSKLLSLAVFSNAGE
jgi:hypothetical protein